MSAKLVRRWFSEVWNERRTETIDELAAPDLVSRGLAEEVHGTEGFRRFHAAFLAQFPAVSVRVDETVETPPDRDQVVTVATRFTVDVKHRSGRPATFMAMCFTRWKGGRWFEAWDVCDFLGLEKQLGHPMF